MYQFSLFMFRPETVKYFDHKQYAKLFRWTSGNDLPEVHVPSLIPFSDKDFYVCFFVLL